MVDDDFASRKETIEMIAGKIQKSAFMQTKNVLDENLNTFFYLCES